jgi:hypothetical protein
MLKNPISVLVMVFALTACGGGNSGDDVDGEEPVNSNDNGEIVDSGGDGGASGKVTELEGTWIKPCGIMDMEDPETHYDVVEIVFTGSRFTSDIKNYVDSSCTQPLSFAPNPTASGTFALGGEVTTESGIKAREMDSHITTFDGADFNVDKFTIYAIETGALYMGADTDEKDGSTPEHRATTLDFERAYFAQ